MTNKINDGGAAFPCLAEYSDDKIHTSEEGMTLRDYFAAQILPSMYYAPESHNPYEHAEVARRAYQYADAMLKVRQGQS